MTSGLHTDSDERQSLGQTSPPAEPPLATLPTPPGGRIAASVQRTPLGWRWALGLGLAFLSGFAYLFSPTMSVFTIPPPPVLLALGLIVTFALALAAGFVLSSWWSALALAVATTAGGLVVSWMMAGGLIGASVEMNAVSLAFEWFALFWLGPLIAFLLAGVGIGKWRGITLGRPHALSASEATVSRWVAALALVIAGGLLASDGPIGLAYAGSLIGDVMINITGILLAIGVGATCLLAGWLWRSWWGFLMAPIVYVGVAALVSQPYAGWGNWAAWWTMGVVEYIIAPAVVMSAIGTIIGMYRAGQRAQRPQRPQLPQTALPAS